MTRAQCSEISATRERLKAAAKATTPATWRAAAQLREDLAQWQRWAAEGVKLPGLPRRIRRAMAPRTAAPNKKDLKVKKVGHKKGTQTIQNVQNKFSGSEIQELLTINYGKCRAIAMAIIGKYRLAEDCVSSCMVSALEQTAGGRVSFVSTEKFCAWLHQIIRFNARKVARTVTYIRGDFLPSKGILPSIGRKDESTEANEQADPYYDEEPAEPEEDAAVDQFDSARVWGRSKQIPNLAEQGY
jgi:DNA-directed RNA polymerase specialized sigma24 family protein